MPTSSPATDQSAKSNARRCQPFADSAPCLFAAAVRHNVGNVGMTSDSRHAEPSFGWPPQGENWWFAISVWAFHVPPSSTERLTRRSSSPTL